MRGMTSWKVFLAISAGTLLLCSLPAEGMDTAFSYQGRLTDGGSPANGAFDFRFFLYNAEAGGSQIGATLYGDDISVNDGLFTVQLDFGPGTFDGDSLWLEVGVRPGASAGTYTPLAPRQAILPSPYALHSGTIEVGAVGSAEVANDSLTASDLAPNSVAASEIAANAVGTSEVADNSLTANDLAPNSVGASEIATGAVAGSEILDNSITTTDIYNGTITYSDTNVNSVQRRVTGTCAAGSSIRTIYSTGSVTCEADTNTNNFNNIYHTGRYDVNSYNGVDGSITWGKGASTNSICFLVENVVRDTDSSNEYAGCHIDEETTLWRLTADTATGDDADAFCAMQCIYWYKY